MAKTKKQKLPKKPKRPTRMVDGKPRQIPLSQMTEKQLEAYKEKLLAWQDSIKAIAMQSEKAVKDKVKLKKLQDEIGKLEKPKQ